MGFRINGTSFFTFQTLPVLFSCFCEPIFLEKCPTEFCVTFEFSVCVSVSFLLFLVSCFQVPLALPFLQIRLRASLAQRQPLAPLPESLSRHALAVRRLQPRNCRPRLRQVLSRTPRKLAVCQNPKTELALSLNLLDVFLYCNSRL